MDAKDEKRRIKARISDRKRSIRNMVSLLDMAKKLGNSTAIKEIKIEVTELARAQVRDRKTLKSLVRCRLTPRYAYYIRVGEVPIGQVLPVIGMGEFAYFKGEKVRINSDRLKLFKHSQTCVGCQLEAAYFAVEKSAKDNAHKYHLNMYGVLDDGSEMLFTKDHVKPRSKGGEDIFNNLQVMCFLCNALKGDTYNE